jgi:hypothetical protein
MTDSKCLTCGTIGHFVKECSDCENLNEMDKCFKYIGIFISEKRNLEKLLKNNLENSNEYLHSSGVIIKPSSDLILMYDVIETDGSCRRQVDRNHIYAQEYRQHKDKIKTKIKKIQNDEYLPIFEAFHKILKNMNEKDLIKFN